MSRKRRPCRRGCPRVPAHGREGQGLGRLVGLGRARGRGTAPHRRAQLQIAGVDDPVARKAARRITLRSSRTLPGQSCARQQLRGASGGQLAGCRFARVSSARKCAPAGGCRRGARAGAAARARTPRGGGRGRCGSVPRPGLAPQVAQGERPPPARRPGSRRCRPPGAAARSPARAAASAAASSGSSPTSSSNKVPPGGLLEPAGAAAVGAGERAALVTEQLALRQLAREGAAVDGHEGPAGVGAQRRAAARASSSLPVPLSPTTSTGAGAGATFTARSIWRTNRRSSPIKADRAGV